MAPPSWTIDKILAPLFDPVNIFGPPLDHPKKFWPPTNREPLTRNKINDFPFNPIAHEEKYLRFCMIGVFKDPNVIS